MNTFTRFCIVCAAAMLMTGTAEIVSAQTLEPIAHLSARHLGAPTISAGPKGDPSRCTGPFLNEVEFDILRPIDPLKSARLTLQRVGDPESKWIGRYIRSKRDGRVSIKAKTKGNPLFPAVGRQGVILFSGRYAPGRPMIRGRLRAFGHLYEQTSPDRHRVCTISQRGRAQVRGSAFFRTGSKGCRRSTPTC